MSDSFARLVLAHSNGEHVRIHPECGACEIALDRCLTCGGRNGQCYPIPAHHRRTLAHPEFPEGEAVGSPVGEWEQTAAEQAPPTSF